MGRAAALLTLAAGYGVLAALLLHLRPRTREYLPAPAAQPAWPGGRLTGQRPQVRAVAARGRTQPTTMPSTPSTRWSRLSTML